MVFITNYIQAYIFVTLCRIFYVYYADVLLFIYGYFYDKQMLLISTFSPNFAKIETYIFWYLAAILFAKACYLLITIFYRKFHFNFTICRSFSVCIFSVFYSSHFCVFLILEVKTPIRFIFFFKQKILKSLILYFVILYYIITISYTKYQT